MPHSYTFRSESLFDTSWDLLHYIVQCHHKEVFKPTLSMGGWGYRPPAPRVPWVDHRPPLALTLNGCLLYWSMGSPRATMGTPWVPRGPPIRHTRNAHPWKSRQSMTEYPYERNPTSSARLPCSATLLQDRGTVTYILGQRMLLTRRVTSHPKKERKASLGASCRRFYHPRGALVL